MKKSLLFPGMRLIPVVVFSILFSGCASLNERLGKAVFKGHTAKVKKLLEKGADPNAITGPYTQQPVFSLAINLGNPKIIKMLLENGADANTGTALIVMIRGENPEIVKMLLEKGADVNAKGPLGETALMAGVQSGNMEIVKTLLEKAADVNAEDDFGLTPLMKALYPSEKAIIAKFDIAKAMEEGMSPAEAGAAAGAAMGRAIVEYKGNSEMVKLLLETGADANTQDKYGSTVLAQAANKGNAEIVKMLLEKGADVNAARSNFKNWKDKYPEQRENHAKSLLLIEEAQKEVVKQAAIKAMPAIQEAERAGDEAARAGDSEKAMAQYSQALKEAPEGTEVAKRLRKKIIQYSLSLDPSPAVPEEAQRLEVQGQALLEKSQSREDYQAPFAKLQKAVDIAPWWADGYYNLGLLQEKMEDYGGSIESLNYYLLANPQAQDAADVQTKIYKLEALKEQQEGPQKPQ